MQDAAEAMYEDCMILSMRFPQKLWRIVNECESGAIRWNASGTTILLDYKKFQEEYLDPSRSIFKTKNITSFIRQLNLYGFRKVTSHSRDPICNVHNPDVHEFLHSNFRAGRADLLATVYRKTGGKSKCYHRVSPRPRCNFAETERTCQMSRLQACQMALTRTLEQIAREYQQKSRKNCSGERRLECEKCKNEERFDKSAEEFDFDCYTKLKIKPDVGWNVSRSSSDKNENVIGYKHCHSCCVTR